MNVKSCTCCHEPKPAEEFPRNRTRRDGLSERCRICKNAADAARRARKREARRAAAAALADGKICSKCGVQKPLAEFYTHGSSPDKRHGGCKDGRHGQCKDCMKAASRVAWALRRASERKAITRRQSLFSVPQQRGDRPQQYERIRPLQESDPEALRLKTVDELIAEVRQRKLNDAA